MQEGGPDGLLVEVEATGLTAAGEGVARVDGRVVFVPGLLPGEKAQVSITSSKKSFCRGRLEKLVTASPHRVGLACSGSGRCGGCPWRHLAYPEQLKWKQRLVEDALRRIAGITADTVRPLIGMAEPNCYRNKLKLRVGPEGDGWALGLLESGSHTLVASQGCDLADESISRLAEVLAHNLQVLGPRATVPETLTLRASKATGQLTISADPAWGDLRAILNAALERQYSEWHISDLERNTILLNPPSTSGQFVETVAEYQYRVGPNSFFQINTIQAGVLVRLVRAYLEPVQPSLVFDLYCGVGLFAVAIADLAGEVVGVENDAQAIELARANAALNGWKNVSFAAAKAEVFLSDALRGDGRTPQAVVADPPRAGLSPEVRKALIALGPARIVYVSCDPATLARDLREFTGVGYRVVEVQPVDMFPHTGHAECVAICRKSEC